MYGSNFGAESPEAMEAEMPSRLGNLWMRAQLLTPQWIKEAATITAGVFGGLTLFRVFRKRLPKPQSVERGSITTV